MAKKIPNLLAAAQNAKRKGNNSLLSVAGQTATRRKSDSPGRNIANEISYAKRSNANRSNANRREDRTLVGQQIAQNAVRNEMARAVTAENPAALSPLERAAINRASELSPLEKAAQERAGELANMYATNRGGMKSAKLAALEHMKSAKLEALEQRNAELAKMTAEMRNKYGGVPVTKYANDPAARTYELIGSPLPKARLPVSYEIKELPDGYVWKNNGKGERIAVRGTPSTLPSGLQTNVFDPALGNGSVQPYAPLEGWTDQGYAYTMAMTETNQKFAKHWAKTKTEYEKAVEAYNKAVEKGKRPEKIAELEADVAKKKESLDLVERVYARKEAMRPEYMPSISARDNAEELAKYYNPQDWWEHPLMSPITDTIDGAYQMLTGQPSFRSADALEDAKEVLGQATNIGLGKTLLTGGTLAGTQVNDFLLGVAENAVALTGGDALGRMVNPNYKNVFTSLREANANNSANLTSDALRDASGFERVLMNVESSALNSAAHMALGSMFGAGVGKSMGVSPGSMPTAMQSVRGAGAVKMANMGSFTLASMNNAYDRAEEDGASYGMKIVRAISAGAGSMIANSRSTEMFMNRMGLGVQNPNAMSRFIGTRMYNTWGAAALNWAKDSFGSQGLAEGTQEVIEAVIDKGLDAGFTGNLANPEYWEGFGEELGSDFFYGYFAGALYSVMAMPEYAPSKTMLGQMVTGEVETTPENMANFFEQVGIDLQTPGIRQEVGSNIEQSNVQYEAEQANTAGEWMTGETYNKQPVEQLGQPLFAQDTAAPKQTNPLVAAAEQVAVQRQANAENATVASVENENGVSMFDQPMQASFTDKESGGDVSVVGFDTTTDGRDVILHTVDQNGNEGTATIAELEFADETVSDLLSADDVRGLDGQGLRNYLSGYAAEVDGHSVAPGEYAKAYGMVYRRAAAGMDMDQAIGSSVIPQVMTETAMLDAYAAGLGAAAQQQTAAPLSPATTGNAGVMNRNFTKAAWQSMSREQQRMAAANMEVVGQLAKRMNATINIVDSLTDGKGGKVNGRYDPSTGVIDIALDADGNAYAYVAMHELTHKMKAEHAKDFETFAEWVKECLQESGQDFEALVQYQMDAFGYSREDAIEEVLCNTVPALLESEQNLRKLYQQDKSLFERVMDWLKGLIADVQAAGKNLSQRSRSWAQMDALAADEAQLQGLYDVMESIMQSEGENAVGNSAVKESRKDNGESKHYDYSKPFAEQIDDWLNGTFPEKDTLLISTTPDVLQRIGFSKLPMAYDQKHMRKVLGNPKNRDHDLGVDFMKKLPELIADPVAILSTPKRDGSIIMVLAHKNEKASNRPVVAIVSPLAGGGYNTIYVDASKTETVHSRGDLSEIIKAAVETEKAGGVGVYYVAEKKSLHSVLEHGQSQVLDSLNRTGYLHSIHDVGSDVNVELVPQTESRQFTHWFRGSKVVNPDGTPKVMYHGTATEFWAFDKKKANDLTGRRRGLGAGKGKFYLTEYRGSAQLAADSAQQTGRGTSPKVMELYVSAKKVMDRSEYDQRLQEAYKQYPNSDPRGSGYDYRQRDKAVAAVDKAIQKEGYDGVWDRDSGEMFVYEPTQIKSATDNIGLFDGTNPDIRYSRSDYDSAYSAAVEQGDTDKAKELVAQAAEASMPDSKLRTPDGKLRVVYHGTNSGDFTVFDPQYIGMSSGDSGFFGRGFYFAYSNGEASYYGRKRIIPAYLNLTNPFNFQANLHEYNGERTFDYNASNAVALVNFADKFPQIAEKMTIDVARKSDGFEAIPIREFADAYKKVLAETEFTYDEVEGEFGEKETVVLADPEIHEFEYGGEKHTFKDHGFQRRVAGKVDKLSIAYEYLASRVYSSVDVPNFTRVILDHNTEFTAALKEMGYDGVIQSEDGDEAVAFEPSQIKSAESVTYDDAGKVIPLSERFQTEEQDFRYSMSDYDATVKEGDVVLEDLLTMTAAHKMTDAEARRVAQKALKAGSSTMDADDAARRIKEIFDYASRSGKVDVDGLNSEVRALAEEMMSQSATLDEQHEADVADLRSYLKTTPIALSPGQQREAAHLMDSYGAYRRALFGQVNLRKSGIGLDQVWGELNEMYPHLFPADTSEGDQVRVLMDIAEYVKPVYRNETGFNMEESIQWMTHEIYNAYMSLSGVQSAAKEQNRLGLKLRDYRAITKRFAQEHKAAYEEMAARVASAADRRVAEAESKAERRADMAIRDAEDTAAREIRKAQEQARQDITDAVAAEMQFSNSRIQEAQMRAEAYIKKVSDADKKARYQAQIIREANQMIKKLEKPTDKNHVQHELAEPLAEFLRSLNTGRKTVDQRALGDRIIRLKLKMAAAGAEGEGHSVMVDPDMLATMEFLGEQLKHTTSLDELNVEQMMRIRNIVHHASWIVGKADEAFADARRKRISDSANEWLAQVKRRKDVKQHQNFAKMRNFLKVGQLDSFHFFDKLGGTAREMFQNLRVGWDKKIRHRADAMEFVEKAKEGLSKKVQKKLFAGKRARKENYTLTNGSIELTRPQLMELYCLAKRPQARMHLFSEKGGIRSTEGRRLQVTEEDVQKLTDNLTAEEKKLADTLQRYMVDECARWGNETSMNLYGYQKFTEENYYPIRVDQHSVESNISESGKTDNLYAVANMGMTKALQDVVTNGLMLGDIFDTFTRHADNMATYNGLAAPITDLVRWYNYKGKDSSVKEELAFKFGREYMEYIPRLIRDINGEKDRSYTPGITDGLISKMKSSAVGANARVVIQQPTAILRAGSMMSYQHIMRGIVGLKGETGRRKLREATELAKKHCPIAALKAMGFYETDLGKSMRTAMFDDRTAVDKMKDAGMSPAGKADEYTFGMIWRACEAETRKLHTELTVGSEAYYKAVGQRMSEIIDYTQVVDTPLHRTQLMRSNNALAKMATSFMSEASKTYNMIYGAVANYVENRKDPVAKRKLARTLSAFVITGVVNGMAQSLIDAIRDDEDEEWWKKFCKHFFGDYSEAENFWQAFKTFWQSNLAQGYNPFGMIPFIKDVLSLAEGWDVNRPDMQSAEKLFQVGENVGKLFTGKNKLSGWGWAQQAATAVDSVTGLSLNNLLRDGYAVTNLLFSSFGAEPPISKQTEAATTSVGYDNLYKAMLTKDAKRFDRVSGKMSDKHGKTEKDLDSELAVMLAEDEDERVVAAYTAKDSGKAVEYGEMRAAFAQEYAEVFGSDTRCNEVFDKAVLKYGKLLNDETEEEEETEEKPLKASAWTNKEMGITFAGLANGSVSKADAEYVLSEMIADSTAKDPEKTVRTNLWAQLKPMYLVAEGEEKKALAGIIKKYCGKTDKDLQKAEKDAAKKATEDESK